MAHLANRFFLFCVLFYPLLIFSQTKKEGSGNSSPKLVVGIVVDQMRNEFIYRYWNRFGNGGFKRLAQDGFYYRNAHYNYIPTYTGPGHASIYTGATPRKHGVIGNDWYVKSNSAMTYCTQDSSAKTIGTTTKNGQMSPKNLLSSTIGDEMKLSSNRKAKVYGIALKDRSAIFPAGHAADGAFWMEETNGEFISSSHYMNDLPRWLKNFNDDRLPKAYLEKWWSTLYPIETYTNSIGDENKFEAAPNKKEFPVFPYEYKSYTEKNDFSIIRSTPFGNSITKDLAIECLMKEELGKDAITDLLCISFSSTDYIGHYYGPRSIEVEDAYLRLDKDIEELLNRLDKEVGKNNYLVFLTADHGAADVPGHLAQLSIPNGNLRENKVLKQVRKYFLSQYGDSLIVSNVSNDQIYLNEKKISSLRLNIEDLEEKLCQFLLTINGVAEAFPTQVLKYSSPNPYDPKALLQNGYNQKLSGNVCYTLKPGWIDHGEKGTTHGSGYIYDTHVPLIFYGHSINKGESVLPVNITQIAPTVCELLNINRPNSSSPELLEQLFSK